MADDLRVVIDTSALVSAVLLPRSVPRQAFDAARRRGRLLVSEATIAELDDVLRRPKFDRYLAEYLRLEFLGALLEIAEVVAAHGDIAACRDPRDDKFLSVAVNGRATHIATGDDDLLTLHPFRGVAIVTPHEFLVQIGPAASQ